MGLGVHAGEGTGGGGKNLKNQKQNARAFVLLIFGGWEVFKLESKRRQMKNKKNRKKTTPFFSFWGVFLSSACRKTAKKAIKRIYGKKTDRKKFVSPQTFL
jgi:hypothetical protein